MLVLIAVAQDWRDNKKQWYYICIYSGGEGGWESRAVVSYSLHVLQTKNKGENVGKLAPKKAVKSIFSSPLTNSQKFKHAPARLRQSRLFRGFFKSY